MGASTLDKISEYRGSTAKYPRTSSNDGKTAIDLARGSRGTESVSCQSSLTDLYTGQIVLYAFAGC